MSKPAAMPVSLRREAQGSHRVALPPTQPPVQLSLGAHGEVEREADEQGLRSAFRLAVNAFGGADALRAALGEQPPYLAKITDALVGGRPIQARWLIPLLDDERSKPIIVNHINKRAGFDTPALSREITAEQLGLVVLAIVRESPVLWRSVREEAAARLNVRVERLP